MNEVELYIQEVFPTPSQAVIQTPEAWIVSEEEKKTVRKSLMFDKVREYNFVFGPRASCRYHVPTFG